MAHKFSLKLPKFELYETNEWLTYIQDLYEDLAEEATVRSLIFCGRNFRPQNLRRQGQPQRHLLRKGLYMLATILKSKQATMTTLMIIETFTKIRELSRTVKALSVVKDDPEQKKLMQRSGELIAEVLDDDLETNGTETTVELNFAVLKFKHTIRKKKE